MPQNYPLFTNANTPFVGVFTVGRQKNALESGKWEKRFSVTDEKQFLCNKKSVMNERFQAIGKYNLSDSALEAIVDNLEKIIVSPDRLMLPLREDIRRVQAWKPEELL